MKERVIRAFIDKDTKEPYNPGKFYESDDKERIKELQDKGFLYKEPTKKETSKTSDSRNKKLVYPIDKGSGWYELSNGEKVQGEKKAVAAQKELDKEG